MHSPKRVLLRRPLQAVPLTETVSDESAVVPQERRKVLLAHKIRPGQTIQLKASKATATMRDDGQPEMQAESLVYASSPKGPQYGLEGHLLSFSVLGPVEEFTLTQSEGHVGSPAVPQLLEARCQHDEVGILSSPPPATQHIFAQLDDVEELQRGKSETASARLRHSETLTALQNKRWEVQMAAIAQEVKVPRRCVPTITCKTSGHV